MSFNGRSFVLAREKLGSRKHKNDTQLTIRVVTTSPPRNHTGMCTARKNIFATEVTDDILLSLKKLPLPNCNNL